MKKLLLVVLLSFSHFSVFSAVQGPVEVRGVVVSYDKDTVTLVQTVQQRVVVPRYAIPKQFKLRTGERVSALFSPEEILKQVKKEKEKEKEKKKKKK